MFKGHRRLKWVVPLVTLLALGVCWALIGVTITFPPKNPLSELKAAQSLWQEQRLSDYVMRAQFVQSVGYFGSYDFVVENGHLSRIEQISDGHAVISPDVTPAWYGSLTGIFLEHFGEYTMDQLFDFAAAKIQSEPAPPVVAWCGAVDGNNPTRPHYHMEFDLKQGYIKLLQYTSCVRYDFGGGLLCPIVTDCNVSIHFTLIPSSK